MRTAKLVLASLLVLASAGSALIPLSAWAQATKRPECKCQNYGRFINAGDTACIRTHKGPQMAKCIMRGNVTDWEFLGEECAHTSMSTIPQPTLKKIKSVSVLQ